MKVLRLPIVTSLLIALASESALGIENNGSLDRYVCNLCHSTKNEHPYPPPALEEKEVFLPVEFGGHTWKFGQLQPTCIQVWENALDSIQVGVFDEASCRDAAINFAPQCCNEYLEKDGVEEQIVTKIGSTGTVANEKEKAQTYLRR